MRSVVCRAWGGAETLKIEDVPAPKPGEGEVLIRVRAAAVNFADTLMIQGQYQTRPDFPFAPGLEASGEVLACGPGAARFSPGDRVMAILDYGGFAEQVTARESETYAVPERMDFETAGSFLLAYASSHAALRWQGRLESGETLLVLGAAGGVGLTATEIGKAMGARVIAAASSAEKLAVAKQHGADEIVNYRTDDLKERVLALTGGKGVHVCFDPVGGDLFDGALSSVGWGGRYIVFGFAGGVPNIPANRLLAKHRSAMGSSLRYFRWYAPEKLRASVEELVGWYGADKLHPLVSKRYPLAEFASAMNELTERRALGRVVVTVD